jgi:hypothetical protein
MNGPNDKKYTAEDISRYLSGRMSGAEMHALEKAALEDPFLSDALEGYAYTSAPEEDLADIRERMSKKKEGKVIPFKRPNLWIRVAAIVVVVLGIGYMGYYFNSPKQDTLAKNDIKPLEKKIEGIKVDTSGAGTMRIKETTATKEVQTGRATKKGEPTIIAPPPSQFSVTDSVNTGTTSTLQEKDNAAFSPSHQKLPKPKQDLFSNNATMNNSINNMDTVGRDIANNKSLSEVQVGKKNRLAAKDTFKTSGVTAMNNIGDVGFSTRKSKLRNKKTIVAKPSKQKQQEVATIGDKRNDDLKAAMNDTTQIVIQSDKEKKEEVLPMVIGIDSFFIPTKGWADFNEYLSDNYKLGDKCKGEMVLSFVLNKKGYPVKINVEKSLSLDCDDKAMKLLLDGPKWNYVKDKRCKVRIRF